MLPPRHSGQAHQRAGHVADAGEQAAARELPGLIQFPLRKVQVEPQRVRIDDLFCRQRLDQLLRFLITPEHGERIDAQHLGAQLFAYIRAFALSLLEQLEAPLADLLCCLIGIIRLQEGGGEVMIIQAAWRPA